MGGRGISWEVASVLVFGQNMQKVMRLYKRRYIICTSYTFITDAIWCAIRWYIVTTHIFGILTSKLCILNVMTRTHLLTVHLELISTCLVHFFRPKLLPHTILEKYAFHSKFYSPLTSSMFFHFIQWVLPLHSRGRWSPTIRFCKRNYRSWKCKSQRWSPQTLGTSFAVS